MPEFGSFWAYFEGFEPGFWPSWSYFGAHGTGFWLCLTYFVKYGPESVPFRSYFKDLDLANCHFGPNSVRFGLNLGLFGPILRVLGLNLYQRKNKKEAKINKHKQNSKINFMFYLRFFF